MATTTPQWTLAAEELVRTSFVLHGAELMLSKVGGGDRFLFDPFEVTSEVIDDWEAANVDAVIFPTFSMELEPFHSVVRQLAAWNAVLHDHADRLVRIGGGEDFARARATDRIGVLISVHFGGNFRTVDDVDFFHRLGQRSSTIVVRGQNAIGCAHHERHETGLSQFGVAVVERMNRVGMAVDIAHANERTSLDVLEVSQSPVYVSHANARGLCMHEKNKSDEVLKKLAEGGGAIAMQPAANLVSSEPPVHLSHFVDQVEYVAQLVGPQAIGFGFEEPYEGWTHLQGEHSPVESVRFKPGEVPAAKLAMTPTMQQVHLPELLRRDRMVVLTEALLERGFSDEDVRGFLGDNIKRTFAQIMRGDGQMHPYESTFRAQDTNIGHIAPSAGG